MRALRRAALALLVCAAAARALSVELVPLEELVRGADLVATVECTRAGIITARYRVVEAWRGAKPGDELDLAFPPDYWGDPYVLVVVGERLFVTAGVPRRREPIAEVPGIDRERVARFELPFAQGYFRLPAAGSFFVPSWPAIRGQRAASWADFGRQIAREVAVPPPVAPALNPVVPEPVDYVGAPIRGPGGGAPDRGQVRAALAARLARYQQPVARGNARYERIRRATLFDAVRQDAPPTDREARVLDSAMRGFIEEPRAARKALAALARFRPEMVVRYLRELPADPKDAWKGSGELAGFARAVERDRATHLRALLRARAPIVRVGAAVYLCYEDEAAGVRALSALANLPDDPGLWAAVTLARRGHADQLERAFRLIFGEPARWDPEGHRLLAFRVIELVVNSAAAAGRPVPHLLDGFQSPFDVARDWWRAHGRGIALVDPWLPVLAPLKID